MVFAISDPHPRGEPTDEQRAYVLTVGKRFVVTCGSEHAVAAICSFSKDWLEFENEVNGKPREPRNFIAVRHDAFRITITRELQPLCESHQVMRGYLKK